MARLQLTVEAHVLLVDFGLAMMGFKTKVNLQLTAEDRVRSDLFAVRNNIILVETEIFDIIL